MNEGEFPGRRSIRLKGYDYSSPGGYFVTLVTRGWECLFGEITNGEMHVNALGKIVEECWNEIPVHFPSAGVDAFVVMPNHVHGIIFIYAAGRGTITVGARHASPLPPHGVPPGSLGAIIGSFKSSVTRRAGRELNSGNIWQRNYYEHILRGQRDYERIANYIALNPINWANDKENSDRSMSPV